MAFQGNDSLSFVFYSTMEAGLKFILKRREHVATQFLSLKCGEVENAFFLILARSGGKISAFSLWFM